MTVLSATESPAPVHSWNAVNNVHDSSLDGIRLIATLMVLLIHISGKGFAELVAHWWAVNTYESVSRICVPLFFMTTGALLLSRTHSVMSVLKRVWKVGLAVLAWSVIYIVYYQLHGAPTSHWLATILKGPFVGHLWYLYTLIPLYFLIPVLAAFFKTSTRHLIVVVLVAGFLLSSVVPFVNRFAGITLIGVDVSVFYIYPLYVLLGACLYRSARISTRVTFACLMIWGSATALTAFFTWLYSKDRPVNTEIFYEYYAPLVVLSAFFAFLSIREITARFVEWQPLFIKPLKLFGELSFGIYLIHPMIIWELDRRGYDWHFVNPWWAVPAVLLAVALISGGVVWVLRKAPYLRAIVPG